MAKKLVQIEVRDKNNQKVLNIWDDVKLSNFDWVINGGLGELILELGRDIRDFGEGFDVSIGNKVKVLIYDNDSGPAGKVIYQGFIASYEQSIVGNDMTLIVNCLGEQTRFGTRIYQDGNTTTITHNNQDPAFIFKDAIEKANLDITTTSTSVDNVGDNVTITFRANTIQEVLDQVVKMSGANFFWYSDADNIANFRKINYHRIDHNFVFGKHFNAFNAKKNIENLVNEVFFIGGGDPNMYRKYTRSTSVDELGLRQKIIVDQRVTVPNTAQKIAEETLDLFDHPITTINFTIVDNNIEEVFGYDIESIKPGDVFRIINLVELKESLWDQAVWDVDFWDFNILYALSQPQIIRKLNYSLNKIEIEGGILSETIAQRFVELARQQNNSQFTNLPASPS